MRSPLAKILTVTLCLNAGGCGTIFHGTHQKVPINISPLGAEVTVYSWSGDIVSGPTKSPAEMTVHRPAYHKPYLVRATKEGYCPKYWLTSSYDTPGRLSYYWLLFVPVFGPILIAILSPTDLATGGCCTIEPQTFVAALQEEASCPQ